MRHKGIERRKKLKDEIKAFPLLVKIHKGEKVEIKQRKERAKETKPRDLREAKFRNEEVYPFLRKDRRIVDYKRIENGICNKHGNGIPDFLFWTKTKQYWLELKADDGGLSDDQKEFKEHCIRTGEAYIEARTIQDIIDGINKMEALNGINR